MQKQRLKQEIGLNLSPQQIQFMNLLQIPLISLEKRREDELESNPALEETNKEKEKNEYTESGWESTSNHKPNREEKYNTVARERELSLQEFLLQQLPMQSLDDDESELAQFIIGCLDDNGFLSRSLLSISDDLLFKLNLNISETELTPILKIVQNLDPTGVGARDLKECLLLQLENKTQTESIKLAQSVLQNQYTAFANKNYEKLLKEFEIDENHREFLGHHEQDPRRLIAESMIKNLPASGTIMAYNESFEKKCIRLLAEHCPDLAEQLLSFNERFLDLIIPFRTGGYYDLNFKGSFSIKSVLPVLCRDNKELTYENLEISDGGSASRTYKNLQFLSEEEIRNKRNNLLRYCRLDTYAMHAIFAKLLAVI